MVASSTAGSERAAPVVAHAPSSGIALIPASAMPPVRTNSLRVDRAPAEPARVAMAAPTIAQTFPARIVTRLPTAEKGGIVCAGGRAP